MEEIKLLITNWVQYLVNSSSNKDFSDLKDGSLLFHIVMILKEQTYSSSASLEEKYEDISNVINDHFKMNKFINYQSAKEGDSWELFKILSLLLFIGVVKINNKDIREVFTALNNSEQNSVKDFLQGLLQQNFLLNDSQFEKILNFTRNNTSGRATPIFRNPIFECMSPDIYTSSPLTSASPLQQFLESPATGQLAMQNKTIEEQKKLIAQLRNELDSERLEREVSKSDIDYANKIVEKQKKQIQELKDAIYKMKLDFMKQEECEFVPEEVDLEWMRRQVLEIKHDKSYIHKLEVELQETCVAKEQLESRISCFSKQMEKKSSLLNGLEEQCLELKINLQTATERNITLADNVAELKVQLEDLKDILQANFSAASGRKEEGLKSHESMQNFSMEISIDESFTKKSIILKDPYSDGEVIGDIILRETQVKLDNQEKENLDLKEKLCASINESKQLKENNEKKRLRNNQLQEECKHLSTKLQTHIQESQLRNSEYEIQIKQLKDDFMAKNIESSELHSNNKELEERNQHLNMEKTKLENRNLQFEKNYAEILAQKEDAQLQIMQLTSNLAAKEQKYSELNSSYNELESKNKTLIIEKNELEGKCNQLESNCSEISSQEEKAQNQIKQLISDFTAKDKCHSELFANYKILEMKNQDLSAEKNKLENKCDQFEKDCHEINSQKKEAQLQIMQLTSDCAVKEKNYSELLSSYEGLEVKSQGLLAEKKQLEAKCSKIEKDYAEIHSQKEETELQNKQLESDYSTKEKNYLEILSSYKGLEIKSQDLASEKNILENKCTKIEKDLAKSLSEKEKSLFEINKLASDNLAKENNYLELLSSYKELEIKNADLAADKNELVIRCSQFEKERAEFLSQKEAAQLEIQQLRYDSSENENNYSVLLSDYKEIEIKNRDLVEEKNKLENKCIDFEIDYAKSLSEKEEALLEIKQLTSKQLAKEKNHSDLLSRYRQLEVNNQAMISKKDELENNYIKLKKDFAQIVSQKAEIQHEAMQASADINEKEKRYTELFSSYKQLENANIDLAAEKRKLDSKCVQLQKDYDKILNEKEDDECEIQILVKKDLNAQSKINELEGDSISYLDRITNLEEKLANNKKYIESMEASLNKSLEDFVECQNSLASLKTKFNEKCSKVSAMEQTELALKSEIGELTSKINFLENVKSDLNGQIGDLYAEKHHLENQRSKVCADFDEKVESLRMAETKVEQLQLELNCANDTTKQLREQVEENAAFSSQLHSIQEEVAHLQESLDIKEQQLSEAQNTLAELEQQKRDYHLKCSELESCRKCLTEAEHKWTEKYNLLELQLKQANDNLKTELKEQKNKYESRIMECKMDIKKKIQTKYSQLLQEVEEDAEKKEKVIDTLMDKLAANERKIEKYDEVKLKMAELENLKKAEINIFSEKYDLAKTKISEVLKEKEQLEEHLKKLKLELESVHQKLKISESSVARTRENTFKTKIESLERIVSELQKEKKSLMVQVSTADIKLRETNKLLLDDDRRLTIAGPLISKCESTAVSIDRRGSEMYSRGGPATRQSMSTLSSHPGRAISISSSTSDIFKVPDLKLSAVTPGRTRASRTVSDSRMIPGKRHHFPNALLNCDEEAGEEFSNSYLADLESGSCDVKHGRLSTLSRRNTLAKPHLRSTYPAETQFFAPSQFADEDLKEGKLESEDEKIVEGDSSYTKIGELAESTKDLSLDSPAMNTRKRSNPLRAKNEAFVINFSPKPKRTLGSNLERMATNSSQSLLSLNSALSMSPPSSSLRPLKRRSRTKFNNSTDSTNSSFLQENKRFKKEMFSKSYSRPGPPTPARRASRSFSNKSFTGSTGSAREIGDSTFLTGSEATCQTPLADTTNMSRVSKKKETPLSLKKVMTGVLKGGRTKSKYRVIGRESSTNSPRKLGSKIRKFKNHFSSSSSNK